MSQDYIIDKLVRIEGTNYDRRRKLTTQDVVNMRKDHKCGVSISKLANKYGCSYCSVKYHVDDDFKKEFNKRRASYAPSKADHVALRADRIEYKKAILKSQI